VTGLPFRTLLVAAPFVGSLASMSTSMGSGRLLVDRILADPPGVHSMDFSEAPEIGVWSTDRDCYEFIADRFAWAGARTLETGSGISTVLLAMLGTEHTVVTPSQAEVDRIVAYCAARDIPTEQITFAVGPSDTVLPALDGPLDMVLIDGCHGFPMTIIDWYYGAGRLVRGGIVIFDDVQLPAVEMIRALLVSDPRWAPEAGSPKWSAWRRLDEGPLGQDWFEQPWFTGPPRPTMAELSRRAMGRAKRLLSRPA